MTRLASNKSALNRARDRLSAYRRVLPALDLKRRQLLAARLAQRRRLEALRLETEAALDAAAEALPMAGDPELALAGRVRLAVPPASSVRAAGVAVPAEPEGRAETPAPGRLADPAHAAAADTEVARVAGLHLRAAAAQEALKRLDRAARRITQRVNLFEKVLIPELEREIRRVSLVLADAQRAGVVTAKIAKAKLALAARGADEEAAP